MKRVLVTISISFSIRYIVRTGLLEKLRSFCVPVIAITWKQEDLIEELRDMGYEVHILPEAKTGAAYRDMRRKIDICFDEYMLKSPSKNIQARYLNQYRSSRGVVLSKARVLYNKIKYSFAKSRKQLFKKEADLFLSDTNSGEYEAFIQELNIDAVFTVTPFHKQEDILLKACKIKGKKMITSILSFDNITKRGWIPVEYDMYLVWNEHNKKQLHRIYPFTKNKQVHITGAPQFDFYFNKEYLLPLDEWKKMVGLPESDRKIILYAGGPGPLFPDEPKYLKQIDESINSGAIRNRPVVLFRCHPIDDIERWKKVVGTSKNVVFDNSWTGIKDLGSANITKMDIAKLCSTLAYTFVHLNVCSTMTVDGSAYNKPQVALAYHQNNKKASYRLEKMYWQEHFVPIMKTNGLAMARSQEEMIDLINNALDNPCSFTKASADILRSIITYIDGKNMERVAEVIKNSLQ